MKYFRILDDVHIKGRWFLGEINFKDEDDLWKYVGVGEIKSAQKNLKVKISKKGSALDFTMGEFEVLIGNKLVSDILPDQDVQKIPIEVIGDKQGHYNIFVIKNEIDCIDREKSEYELFEKDDPIRPDLAGQFSGVSKMIIKSSLQTEYNIFRVKDYEVAIIVSERIKKEFERLKLKGLKFQDING